MRYVVLYRRSTGHFKAMMKSDVDDATFKAMDDVFYWLTRAVAELVADRWKREHPDFVEVKVKEVP